MSEEHPLVGELRNVAAHWRSAQREEEHWREIRDTTIRAADDAGVRRTAIADALGWQRAHVTRLLGRRPDDAR